MEKNFLKGSKVPTIMGNRLYTAQSIIDDVAKTLDELISTTEDKVLYLDDDEQFTICINGITRKVIKITTDYIYFEDGYCNSIEDMSYGETFDFLDKLVLKFEDVLSNNEEDE